jgi:superoxide dismutase, Fe-Mn family
MDAQRRLSMPPRQLGAPATVMVRPLLLKPQWMNGLSERLLVSHYENNYGGAVRRLNAIRAHLAALDWTRTPVFEINGLKREELIAAGSLILHEIYFDSLGGHGDDPPTGLAEPPDGLAHALARDFGSIMAWRAEFTAMAKALAGGSGWAILAWSERFGRLVNQWAADHTHGVPGATPILALDMYEHSYHLDFGAKATAYVDQVMANLNWERIGARYRAAIGEEVGNDKLFLPFGAPAQEEARIPAEELKTALENGDDRRPVLLDLCLPRDLPRRHRYAARCLHARSCRSTALGRGVVARPADRRLLHLRISGERHGSYRVATARLRRQGSRRWDYRLACNWRHDSATGHLDL